jgi:hypothetical protein
MQYLNGYIESEATMLQLRVYYHDVLRYTIIANWDKVQELRNKGFNVQVKEVAGQGLELGVHKPVEVRSDSEYGAICFY